MVIGLILYIDDRGRLELQSSKRTFQPCNRVPPYLAIITHTHFAKRCSSTVVHGWASDLQETLV